MFKERDQKTSEDMVQGDSLDNITEGSTLKNAKRMRKRRSSSAYSYEKSDQPTSDLVGRRIYNDVLMDKTYGGHKDSKNKRLTVPLVSVHNMRNANEQTHNPGDFRENVSLSKILGDKVKVRVFKTQPDGCNGPVMCKTGKVFQKSGVITMHDPDNPVHAATQKQFSHGGVQFEEKMSMMGASQTLPNTNPENAALDNAAGLHYAINIGKGDAVSGMHNANFMQRVGGLQDK
jgi:hypothetical protein